MKPLTHELKSIIAEQENLLNEKSQFDKSSRRVELGSKAQEALEEYLRVSRIKKVNEFKENFLECFSQLIGKQNLVGNVTVAPSNFDITSSFATRYSYFQRRAFRRRKANLCNGDDLGACQNVRQIFTFHNRHSIRTA